MACGAQLVIREGVDASKGYPYLPEPLHEVGVNLGPDNQEGEMEEHSDRKNKRKGSCQVPPVGVNEIFNSEWRR